MKYLIKFNENINLNELKDFCETHLAYLLDNSRFRLDVEPYKIGFVCTGGNSIGNDWLEGYFKWDEVKDTFIPFLIHLKNKYGVKVTKKIRVYTRLSGFEDIDFDDLVNDTIQRRCEIIGYWWTRIHIEIIY